MSSLGSMTAGLATEESVAKQLPYPTTACNINTMSGIATAAVRKPPLTAAVRSSIPFTIFHCQPCSLMLASKHARHSHTLKYKYLKRIHSRKRFIRIRSSKYVKRIHSFANATFACFQSNTSNTHIQIRIHQTRTSAQNIPNAQTHISNTLIQTRI